MELFGVVAVDGQVDLISARELAIQSIVLAWRRIFGKPMHYSSNERGPATRDLSKRDSLRDRKLPENREERDLRFVVWRTDFHSELEQ